MLNHGNPLHTHAEGKSSNLLRVISVIGRISLAAFRRDRREDGRINHATPKKLNPARVLALPAALAPTKDTTELHIRRWLRKRKEAWKEACFHIRTEQRLH